MRASAIYVLLGALLPSVAAAASFDDFGPFGEGGSANGQNFTIGPGGHVFEVDSFLAVGAADSLQLSLDALPEDTEFSFEAELSDDTTDVTLRYVLRNNGAALEDVRFFSFVDVEIDEDINTFSNEYATIAGSLGAGSDDPDPDSYEVDESGFVFGDIIANLAAGQLDDTNAIPEDAPEDVSVVLGFDIGTLLSRETVTIEVMVSEDGSVIGGFSITQADTDPQSTTTVTYSGQVSRELDVLPGQFRRGDYDGAGAVDAADAAAVLAYLFDAGAGSNDCLGEALLDSADGNDNETITIADYLAIRNAVDGGGTLPVPSASCGDDPDDDPRGFDATDPDYVLAAGDLEIVPPVGAEDRDVFVPVLVQTPRALTGLTVILEFDDSSLTPFDPDAGDPPLFESALGESRVLVDAENGRLVISLWTTHDGETLVEADAAPQEVGRLGLHIEDFAIVRPFAWVEETDAGGRTFRSTLVDDFFDDHHPDSFSGGFEFVRGNSNNDARVDLSDSVYTLSFLFSGGPTPVCMDAADSNNDSKVDISDPVYSLNFLFLGGPAIPPPYPLCGFDVGPVDLLGCNECACPPYEEGHPCNP